MAFALLATALIGGSLKDVLQDKKPEQNTLTSSDIHPTYLSRFTRWSAVLGHEIKRLPSVCRWLDKDKTSDQVGGALKSVFSNFNANNRKLNSNNDDRGVANDDDVVRLSGSGRYVKQSLQRDCFYVLVLFNQPPVIRPISLRLL
jgi:hypothetical protein